MATKAAAKDAKPKKAKPVTGFAPLKFKDMTITQKRSCRYEVVNVKGKNVNAAEKVQVLLEANLLQPSLPKAAAEAAAPQA